MNTARTAAWTKDPWGGFATERQELADLIGAETEAQRALSSGPGKMMAARGMAPLANPVDLLSVLYQLCMDVDPKLAGAARASAKALPAKILTGALAEVALDPRVIDFFIREADEAIALVETVVLNKSTADETIARLAARADSRLVGGDVPVGSGAPADSAAALALRRISGVICANGTPNTSEAVTGGDCTETQQRSPAFVRPWKHSSKRRDSGATSKRS